MWGKIEDMKTYKKGFTLIELLVVIAIIGILSGVVLTNLNSARARAKDGRRISDVKSIQLALELFAEHCNGRYPTASPLTTTSGNASCPGISFGTYLNTIPKDPGNPSLDYKYVPLGSSAATCYEYHIGTSLETNNTVLNDDADLDTSSASGFCATVGASGIHGSSNTAGPATCGTTAGSPERCFDVRQP